MYWSLRSSIRSEDVSKVLEKVKKFGSNILPQETADQVYVQFFPEKLDRFTNAISMVVLIEIFEIKKNNNIYV